MAEMYELEILGQPGIYVESEHTVKMYFAEPDNGINKDTGILLILAGYGGSATSHVYTKMRREFADRYNLVTVQCDYFGYEYMQNDVEPDISEEMLKETLTDIELELLKKDYDKYAHILRGKKFRQTIERGETPEYFNDMGLMQAMDNLRAVKVLLDILKDNGYNINQNRVYAYGFSHGAYLAYLCNALWQGIFTGIVDNSAYLIPYYLKNERTFLRVVEGMQITQRERYKALQFVMDEDILMLSKLYEQFENKSNIICYAGEEDYMTLLEDKKNFLNRVNHSHVETVTKYRIDKVHFNSAGHGLDADFLELFSHANRFFLAPKEEEWKKKRQHHQITYENVTIETSMFHYDVKWEDGMPVLYRSKKEQAE